MLPAEKTHYRKGLALGLTMAETFSIIVFILLLACAVLLISANEAKGIAEDNLKEERMDHAFTRQMLENVAPADINTDAWLRESRRLREELTYAEDRIKELKSDSVRRSAEIEALQQVLENNDFPDQLENNLVQQAGKIASLSDSLVQASHEIQELEHQQDSLKTRLQEAKNISEAACEAITQHEGLNPTEAAEEIKKAARADSLTERLEVARDLISSLETGRVMWDSLATVSSADSLRATAVRERMRSESMQNRLAAREREREDAMDRLATANRERDEAIGRAGYWKQEVERLRVGLGIEPPPCWLDDENNPEYMFQAVLTDSGIRLFDITPPHRRNDPVIQYLSAIEDGRTYAEEFRNITRPIYYEGLSRRQVWGPKGCRFWVLPVDRTGERKDIFREWESQLWDRFWFNWP